MYNILISHSIQTLRLPVIPVKLFNAENHSLLLVDTGSDRSIMDITVYNHFKDKITNSEQGQNIHHNQWTNFIHSNCTIHLHH